MKIRPSQVVVGPGAKPTLFFPTLALVEPGDEVIMPSYTFVSTANAFVLRGVVDAYPVGSVKDIARLNGFFNRMKFTAGGEKLTLDAIENGTPLPPAWLAAVEQEDGLFPALNVVDWATVEWPTMEMERSS